MLKVGVFKRRSIVEAALPKSSDLGEIHQFGKSPHKCIVIKA